MLRRLLILSLLVAFGTATATSAQDIDQAKGADKSVNYAELTKAGPWDDRNYELTAEDLAFLGPNEQEAREAIPAFYRVELRKQDPDLLTVGEAQYPRSGLPYFLLRYGGYLVDGTLYRSSTHESGRWTVKMEEGISSGAFVVQRFLNGDAMVNSFGSAAESAIAINPVNNDLVIAGANGPAAGQTMFFSTDGGETWAEAAALPGGTSCCDPSVEWSTDGTKAYAAALGGSDVWFYRSADGGQTWNDLETNTPGDPRREFSASAGLDDKEFLHVDNFPASPHVDNLYLTWHAGGNVMRFTRSTDGGNTWDAISSFTSDDNGIGSDIASDKGGNVYYIWPAFGTQRVLVKKSTDGGATFGPQVEIAPTNASFIFPVPSFESRQVFVYTSADVDYSDGAFADSIYVAWTDNTGPDSGTPANNHARIQVAYSRDAGATWTVTTPHETADANTVDRYHQWLGVAPDGSVHVIFYDTRLDLPNRNAVDIFHSFSTDGAVTWSTPNRVTTATSPNISGGFEFGDYNGMDVVGQGLIAIWTDNRNEGGGGGDSVDVYAGGVQLAIFVDGFESGDTSGWQNTEP